MTKSKRCDFGYNCKLFLPTLGKCRKLIDSYTTRQELVERRWLSTQELVVYLGVPIEELVRRITVGEIAVRLRQDGKVIYQVSASWQYERLLLAKQRWAVSGFHTAQWGPHFLHCRAHGLEDRSPKHEPCPV